MIQASLIEQIKTFFKILTTNSKLGILGISILVVLFILLISTKFNNKKITKIIYIIAYLGTFGILLYFFHTEILELFDYLINNIFLFLFFPNLAVYILVLVIVNIIIIKSTFSDKDNKIVKILNIIGFILFNVIFYLIIDNVKKNNINVYEQLSIYTNNDLLVLVELSMKLFVVWLLLLGIIKLTSSLAESKKLVKVTNKNLVLVEDTNKLELQNVNTVDNILEITPIEDKIEELPKEDIKEEFIDVVPIKKQMRKLTDKFRFKEDIEPMEVKQETTITEVINKVTPFENITLDNQKDTIVLTKEEKPSLTLTSYDAIFKNQNLELETNVNNNMEIVFEDNNYLQNILFDIEDLKNNMQDEDKIKKIYNDVKDKENELTLSDYNNLINALLNIKK